MDVCMYVCMESEDEDEDEDFLLRFGFDEAEKRTKRDVRTWEILYMPRGLPPPMSTIIPYHTISKIIRYDIISSRC